MSDMENAGPSEGIRLETIRGARDELQSLLGAVQSGELTAPKGLMSS
jgi:hypothetical protein